MPGSRELFEEGIFVDFLPHPLSELYLGHLKDLQSLLEGKGHGGLLLGSSYKMETGGHDFSPFFSHTIGMKKGKSLIYPKNRGSMGSKAGVFCHNGLGDGVNSLVLSNNLHLNGWHVDTYQNMMGSMQEWFPHLKVQPYPKIEALAQILSAYDWYFVVHNDTDEFVKKLIQEGKRRFPDRLKVIYLYPSKYIVREKYYSDCLIDPKLSIAENLRQFCEKILHLKKISKNNGFISPPGLIHRKFLKRVVIHPTSARPTRNWPKEKFVKLAIYLRGKGYEVVFVPGAEKENWKDVEEMGFAVPMFPTLNLLARYIYESGYLIGNDSGLGHLASALGIPTLTFCRRKAWANMWRPNFCEGIVVTPPSWIPNIRGFRLRDWEWRRLISVRMACRGFEKLVQTAGCL